MFYHSTAHAPEMGRGQTLISLESTKCLPFCCACFRMSASYCGQHSGLQGLQQHDPLLDCSVEPTMSLVGSTGCMWLCQLQEGKLQRKSLQPCPARARGGTSNSPMHLGVRACVQVAVTRHGRDVLSLSVSVNGGRCLLCCKQKCCMTATQVRKLSRHAGAVGPAERASVWGKRRTVNS